MIKQVILLSIFFLGLSGCDGFWENIYVGDKVYKNDVRENNIVEEILVLRNTVDTPSFISSYLFEQVSYAEEQEPYKKKDSANRILYASFFLIRPQFDPKMMVKDKKYRVSAVFDRVFQANSDTFCKIENYRPCLEKYDLMWIGKFHIVSIEPIP